MSKTLITILFTLAACGGSSKPVPETATTPSPAIAGDPVATCVQVMTRNRDCTTDFIPALVDLRAQHDNPEGIAEAVKADRAKVVSQALAEWEVDSKDEAIARQCEKIAPTMTNVNVTEATSCVGTAECPAYVRCITPVFAQQIAR